MPMRVHPGSCKGQRPGLITDHPHPPWPSRWRTPPGVDRLRRLLQDWAVGFSEVRADVASPTITWPRRGLLDDESSSFLRALDSGFVTVDRAGFVALPTVRAKTPAGPYALLSKSGSGVSINLEYLIQIGTTAELVLDHGWSASDIDFERGEFDAVGVGDDNRALLVMEAKARVSGPDGLEKLLMSWLRMANDHTSDLDNNAGRKYASSSACAGPAAWWSGWSQRVHAGR
jgi:hypothetical protein